MQVSNLIDKKEIFIKKKTTYYLIKPEHHSVLLQAKFHPFFFCCRTEL